MLVTNTPPFLEHPLLPTPPFLWENSVSLFFRKILKKSTYTLYKEGEGEGGGSTNAELFSIQNTEAKSPCFLTLRFQASGLMSTS